MGSDEIKNVPAYGGFYVLNTEKILKSRFFVKVGKDMYNMQFSQTPLCSQAPKFVQKLVHMV